MLHNTIEFPAPAQSQISHNKRKKFEKKSPSKETVSNALMKTAIECLNSVIVKPTVSDAEELFSKHVASELRGMSNSAKRYAKFKIQEILYKASSTEFNNNDSTETQPSLPFSNGSVSDSYSRSFYNGRFPPNQCSSVSSVNLQNLMSGYPNQPCAFEPNNFPHSYNLQYPNSQIVQNHNLNATLSSNDNNITSFDTCIGYTSSGGNNFNTVSIANNEDHIISE